MVNRDKTTGVVYLRNRGVAVPYPPVFQLSDPLKAAAVKLNHGTSPDIRYFGSNYQADLAELSVPELLLPGNGWELSSSVLQKRTGNAQEVTYLARHQNLKAPEQKIGVKVVADLLNGGRVNKASVLGTGAFDSASGAVFSEVLNLAVPLGPDTDYSLETSAMLGRIHPGFWGADPQGSVTDPYMALYQAGEPSNEAANKGVYDHADWLTYGLITEAGQMLGTEADNRPRMITMAAWVDAALMAGNKADQRKLKSQVGQETPVLVQDSESQSPELKPRGIWHASLVDVLRGSADGNIDRLAQIYDPDLCNLMGLSAS